MRFLAAWFSDPVAYWPNIVGLIAVVVIGVLVIRKVQTKRKAQK